jgi:bacterioferritin-associated ferredoxin
MPRLAFGQEDRDKLTLRHVAELRLTVAFECRNCRHIAQKDILELIEEHGLAAKLGDLRSRAKCGRCGKRAAEVLKTPGVHGSRAWWPHPPRATR